MVPLTYGCIVNYNMPCRQYKSPCGGHTLQFTYKDLEQLTGVAYHLLRQWKQHGYIWDNGTGTGAGGTACAFEAEMIGRIMWLAHM